MSETEPREVTRWGKAYAWWLLHPDIDSDRFCILAALSTYADDKGFCDPSQATLARHLGRSRPWVNKVIAALTEAGFLEKTVRARRNGGTTSCLYRLRSCAAEATVPLETGARSAKNTPSHSDDTNQLVLKQNQRTHAAPSSTKTSYHHERNASSTVAAPSDQRTTQLEGVPDGWTPSTRALQEAAELAPESDLQAHAAMFAARCRAKGYRYAAGRLDDAWLAWFAEDAQRGRRGARSKTNQQGTRLGNGIARAAAWAASASTPPLRTNPWS